MFWRKVTLLLVLLLITTSMTLVFSVPVMAADPPVVWVEFPNGTSSSVNEYNLSNSFTVEVWVDSNVKGIWSWQVGIRFDPTVLECTNLAEGTIFAGKSVLGFMPGYINNTGGYVTYSGNTLKWPETTGVVGTYTLMRYDFHVIGHGNGTLDLTPGWTPNPEEVPRDLVAGTKLNERVDDSILVITGTTLTDGYFDNRGLKPGPYPPTAVITQMTPEPYYVGDTIELYGGNSLPGFDGDSMRPITEYYWDFENDGFIDATGQTVFWNTTGYAPGSYNVNLTVYAPGGPTADPTYNATMQYDDTIDVKTISVLEGVHHDDHLNDPTDDFPNDYAPLVIPVNGKNVTIAPLIMDTTLIGDTFFPYYYPCKSAQTLLVDNDWSDKDANYTYLFEDWTDYDWNDIVVSLYAITNDIIEVEIRIESREATWKNPFSVEITPRGMNVEVYWNSTDYPWNHTVTVNSNETVEIEFFVESNPGDITFMMIIPPSPPPPPKEYTLVVDSTPITGVTVTIDGIDYTTPTPPLIFKEGIHVIIAQSTITVGADTYNFKEWEDGSTEPIRTLYLSSNLTITATYELIPSPPPVGGHAVTIDVPHLQDRRIVSALSLLVAVAVTLILIRRKNKTLKQEY